MAETAHEYVRPNGRTNYEDVVPFEVRQQVENMMRSWLDGGRSDQRIGHIVRSAVLLAYAQGRFAGLQEVADFVNARVS